MTTQLSISIGQFSEKGIQHENEDFYATLTPRDMSLETQGICSVIADGMGNSERAAESSEQCVKAFLNDYYSTPETWPVWKSGSQVLSAINCWLHAQGRNALSDGMVTTFSALVFKSTTAHLFHVGDCRIYRFRKDDLECLTNDHRVNILRGDSHLARAMGLDKVLDIDYRALPLELEDLFLMVTDGVHDYLPLNRLKALFLEHRGSLDELAENIVQQSIAAGSQDNATAQIIRIECIPVQNEKEIFSRLSGLPFPPFLEPGMLLDGYQIEELIHSSQTSQIFLVKDQLTGRELVMKAPSVDLKDNKDYVERFYREEWVGRRIHSPFVTVVQDPGKKRSFLYYVMEKVEGVTLAEWMRDNPAADFDVVIELLQKIVAGIRVFHRLEMLHRDISPQNIMLSADRNIKIIDFAAVKIAGIEEITRTRESINFRQNWHYAAAELLLGGETDERVDLYSVGVLAYQMLTGHLPYGDQLKRMLNWNTLNKIEYISAIRYNPKIPLWMDAALEKAVTLDMNSRYEVFSEFLHDLQYPNPQFSQRKKPAPKKDSSTLWKVLALVLLLSNLILILWLLVFDVLD